MTERCARAARCCAATARAVPGGKTTAAAQPQSGSLFLARGRAPAVLPAPRSASTEPHEVGSSCLPTRRRASLCICAASLSLLQNCKQCLPHCEGRRATLDLLTALVRIPDGCEHRQLHHCGASLPTPLVPITAAPGWGSPRAIRPCCSCRPPPARTAHARVTSSDLRAAPPLICSAASAKPPARTPGNRLHPRRCLCLPRSRPRAPAASTAARRRAACRA